MKKIRLKIKIEVVLIILFFVLVAVNSVISVTQTIPDTHSDIETYIKNSKGNYWRATGDNIQAAKEVGFHGVHFKFYEKLVTYLKREGIF